jgi:hypothetical protein
VGVESLLEALFGLVGGGHHLRVAGGKSEVCGSVRGGDDGNAGHAFNGAYSSENVFVKALWDLGKLIDQVQCPDVGTFCHGALLVRMPDNVLSRVVCLARRIAHLPARKGETHTPMPRGEDTWSFLCVESYNSTLR